jgi:hypothetical protein
VEVIAPYDLDRHRLTNRMTAQRSLDVGIGTHQLAIDRDNPIPSLEARFGQLASRPGWHAAWASATSQTSPSYSSRPDA